MLITRCQLVLHDYLFYASREMGRLYETEKYLHNYGLTYALGLVSSPYANAVQIPHYADDFKTLNARKVYVTPAQPIRYTFAFSTFKMSNVNYYNLMSQVSSNQVVFGRAKELAPESLFEFFVLSETEITLPRWIRLGKWMAKGQIHTVTQNAKRVRLEKQEQRMSGTLNPLDLPQMPTNCNIIAMAPASLVTNVYVASDYYESVFGDDTIRLPGDMQYRPTL